MKLRQEYWRRIYLTEHQERIPPPHFCPIPEVEKSDEVRDKMETFLRKRYVSAVGNGCEERKPQ